MPDATTTPGGARAALARPAFRLYLGGEILSMIGTWMQGMAHGWVMTTLTSSAFVIGLAHFATGIPMLLLTMYAGTLADRLDKRAILRVALSAQAFLAVLLGYLAHTGVLQIWMVLAIAVGFGVAAAFEMPAVSALVPTLVEKEDIAAAIALDRAVFHGSRLIGPALGGLVIGAWGTAAAFYVNAVSFLPLILILALLQPRPPEPAAADAPRDDGGIKAGFAYVRQDPATLAMVLLIAVSTFCVFPLIGVMMPLYVTRELGLGPLGMGTMMSANGVGAFVGALGLLSIPATRRLAAINLACGAIAVALLGLALAHTPYEAGACLVMLAVGMSTAMGLANTTVQERAPEHLRGRVSAIAGLAFFGLMPFASLGLTAIADIIHMRPALAGASVVYGLAALGILAGPARRAARPAAPLA